jgi:hypothetical protein
MKWSGVEWCGVVCGVDLLEVLRVDLLRYEIILQLLTIINTSTTTTHTTTHNSHTQSG